MHGVHVVGGSNPLAPTRLYSIPTHFKLEVRIKRQFHMKHSSRALSHVTSAGLIMCALGIIFYCYEYYLRVAPSVLKLQLVEAFSLTETAYGHLFAAFYYAYTPLQIPVGMMMDRFGPRRILTLACFLCALGTYLFAATTETFIAQFSRFIIGFGSAFAYVGVLKISNIWLPKKYFALMAGICTTLGMFFGGIGGQVSMTYLEEIIGWKQTLYFSALAGLFLTLLLWLVLRDGKSPEDEEAFHHPISTRKSRLKFVGLKGMLLSPQMWICGLIGCFTYLPISGFAEAWAADFLKVAGLTSHQAALGSSMLFLGFAVGGPIWGIISDRMKSRRIPLILGSFGSATFLALLIFMPNNSVAWMYTLLFFSTFFASAEILVFAVSNDLSKPSVSATAVSFTNMVVMIGGAFLPPIIGNLLDSSLHLENSLPALTIQDYSYALGVLPISLALSGILAILLKESYHRQA